VKEQAVRDLEDRMLLLLVASASLVFAWILWPFSGAILWATVLGILFAPLYRRILRSMPRWHNLAAMTTLLIVVVMVILPLTIVVNLLIGEATDVYESMRSGKLSLGRDFEWIGDILPTWAINLLGRLGIPDAAALREKLTAIILQSGEFFTGQAINLGQMTVNFIVSFFVMLYLLFFFLRDGRELSERIGNAIPLRADQRQALRNRFTVAVRAIVKGSIVVALVQGALGGLMFWFLGIRAPVLWGAVMAVFSLLPVMGTGLIWGPAAIYLLATGALWQGLILIAFGILVIGLVDNVLRPILIGQDTKIPDYIVLVSTLGGLATFGANGFVIGPVIAAVFLALWTVFSASRLREERF
jgi:predicted PurR-regulated permease PerM